eukprot:TRINITY_DN4223_c0_g1_i2.p1 TRINITY_DN4223_c0_g1~~TRINITY_DN4223_c0_g1_i2.p1  ORF type:complete len:285 (+),score=44.37 TRINITY_DN4223_c0_g1_i2:119-973(+)
MFSGFYNDKQAHQNDFNEVIHRAFNVGVSHIIITGGSATESKEALLLSQKDERLFSTVGVHPTRCGEFLNREDECMQQLSTLIKEGMSLGKVVAVGEFGLDFDRLQFCDKEVQEKYFEKQFVLAEESKLPLFLHMRNCCDSFVEIIKRNRHRFGQGVVHSFTGTSKEAQQLLDLDLHIGLNGCSLKSQENLEAVKAIPINKICLETDSPWCDIRQTHAGFAHVKTKFASKDKKKWDASSLVKGRNEPCTILQVCEVIAGTKGVGVEELSSVAYDTTRKIFFAGK